MTDHAGEPLSLTQYLGRLRAFLDVLHAEAVTLATYVRRLEGQDRERAFGWDMILERARHRALAVIERWQSFNLALDGRVYPDDVELVSYGEHHRLRRGFPETCGELTSLMERIGRYVDSIEKFDRQDVKLVTALVEEILTLVREQGAATRDVGMRLMRTALDDPERTTDEPGIEPYAGMTRNEAEAYLEQYTIARREFEEELRAVEAA